MGCEVNGPGEARAADLGVAGGKGIGLIFKRGEIIRKVPEAQIVDALMEEVEKFAAEKKVGTSGGGRRLIALFPFPISSISRGGAAAEEQDGSFYRQWHEGQTSFYPKPSRPLCVLW